MPSDDNYIKPCPTPPNSKEKLKTRLNAGFNASKPLKNPKFEIMARERAKGSGKAEAYMKAYPKASLNTARANSKIITTKGIDERALYLLAQSGLKESDLFNKLAEHVNGEDTRISFEGTKFALGMIGYGKEQKESSQVFAPVQINFVVHQTVKPNDVQPIDITIDKVDSNDAS